MAEKDSPIVKEERVRRGERKNLDVGAVDEILEIMEADDVMVEVSADLY